MSNAFFISSSPAGTVGQNIPHAHREHGFAAIRFPYLMRTPVVRALEVFSGTRFLELVQSLHVVAPADRARQLHAEY